MVVHCCLIIALSRVSLDGWVGSWEPIVVSQVMIVFKLGLSPAVGLRVLGSGVHKHVATRCQKLAMIEGKDMISQLIALSFASNF